MLLVNRATNIQSTIEGYQDKIAQLQDQIAQLQKHQQQVDSVNSACESAIEQVKVALQLLNSVCPEEIGIFKSAIDTLYSPPLLESHVEADEKIETVTDVDGVGEINVDNLESEIVDVEVEVESEVEIQASDAAQLEIVSKEVLLSLTKAKLVELAKKFPEVKSAQGKNKSDLVELLHGKILTSDIE